MDLATDLKQIDGVLGQVRLAIHGRRPVANNPVRPSNMVLRVDCGLTAGPRRPRTTTPIELRNRFVYRNHSRPITSVGP